MKMIFSLLLVNLLFSNIAKANLPYAFDYAPENSVRLVAPHYAEYGGEIPIAIKAFNAPATRGYITDIRFYVDYNPDCPVAHFKMAPGSLAEGLKIRLKLLKSATVYALVEYNNGLVYKGQKYIKISCPACVYYSESGHPGLTREQQSYIHSLCN